MESKKKYTVPSIEIIFLDNEISLSLESTPPEGPDEGLVGFNQNDPFKLDINLA